MREDLVSIIVPVYNVEKFVEKCVKSLMNQTHKNIEIILVDDGSPDHSPELLIELQQKIREYTSSINKIEGFRLLGMQDYNAHQASMSCL